MLHEAAPALQAPAAEAQLPSPPAPELQQAPDEPMQEAQELSQLPDTQGAGDGESGLPARHEAQQSLVATLLLQTMQVDAPEATPAEPVAAPSMRIPSPLRVMSPGAAALGAAPAAEAGQAQPQPLLSLAPSPGGLAAPAARTTPLLSVELASAAAAQLAQSPGQRAMTAPAALPEQSPPPGLAQRSARLEARVEPTAQGRAEPAVHGAAAPPTSAPKSLDEVCGLVHAPIRPRERCGRWLHRACPCLTKHRLADVS